MKFKLKKMKKKEIKVKKEKEIKMYDRYREKKGKKVWTKELYCKSFILLNLVRTDVAPLTFNIFFFFEIEQFDLSDVHTLPILELRK